MLLVGKLSAALGKHTSQRFPNGELNLTALRGSDATHALLVWENDADLLELMLTKKRLGSQLRELDIAYMPYSRMDRDADGGSNCTLRHVGEFIQSLGFDSIRVCDPHSDLTLAYLGDKAESYYPLSLGTAARGIGVHRNLEHAAAKFYEPVLMFPDAGAYKRYAGMPTFAKAPTVVGFKHRDFNTSRILGFHLSTNGIDLAGRAVVIVDDLCSSGFTFLYAAKALREAGAADITLMVTHCEDTIHGGELLKEGSPVDRVITTNSILRNQEHPKLLVVKTFPINMRQA